MAAYTVGRVAIQAVKRICRSVFRRSRRFLSAMQYLGRHEGNARLTPVKSNVEMRNHGPKTHQLLNLKTP